MIRHVPELKDEKVELKRVSGLTNVTYAVLVNGTPNYIFKQFTEGYTHDFEYKVCVKLSRQGLIPAIVFANKHYRIDEFVQNSRHPAHQEIVEESTLTSILAKLHQIHELDMSFQENEH